MRGAPSVSLWPIRSPARRVKMAHNELPHLFPERLGEDEEVRKADFPVPIQLKLRIKPRIASLLSESCREQEEVVEIHAPISVEVGGYATEYGGEPDLKDAPTQCPGIDCLWTRRVYRKGPDKCSLWQP